MAQAECPASCGEIIQGWVLGGEKLISCPVEWYSCVEATFATPIARERPKMRAMVNMLLAYWQLPADLTQAIRIEYYSTIPVAKGMASSTADIAATAVATARLLELPLKQTELARLCVALEPTDSTIFSQLTLFDHITADTQIACEGLPSLELLLLESPQTLTTAAYHRMARRQELVSNSDTLDRAWKQVQRACALNDAGLLGEAATISAIASQTLLPKPEFHRLLDLVERYDLYGINVAHSGSVVGLMLNSSQHDVDKIRWGLRERKLTTYWPQSYLLNMVAGGVRIR
ncbi:L-threonine kinase [Salmonella enterica]